MQHKHAGARCSGVFSNVTSPSTKAKLRLLFEVAPLGLLVEKAGGESSCDGKCVSALDVEVTEIDQRTQVRDDLVFVRAPACMLCSARLAFSCVAGAHDSARQLAWRMIPACVPAACVHRCTLCACSIGIERGQMYWFLLCRCATAASKRWHALRSTCMASQSASPMLLPRCERASVFYKLRG